MLPGVRPSSSRGPHPIGLDCQLANLSSFTPHGMVLPYISSISRWYWYEAIVTCKNVADWAKQPRPEDFR